MKSRERIIRASKIDKDDYERIIEKLEIKYKVIEPFISIYWCDNQLHDQYSFYICGHSTRPIIKCPICSQNLSVATFYYFKPEIAKLLLIKEGLIQALSMFIIDNTEKKWLPGVYLEGEKDSEKDIVVETSLNKYTIIEIKNYVKDNPRAIKSNITSLMSQALKHLNKYKERDIEVEDIYLVVNYDYNDEIQDIINKNLSKDKFSELKSVNLKLIGINNIKDLQEIKNINFDDSKPSKALSGQVQ